VAELRAALPASIKLHYAMKANPMPAVVSHMARLVDGIDVASGGELRVALDSGADPHEISFAGPGKRHAELRQAVAAGILINIESFREVAELAAIRQATGLPARVAVRVNPDFELKGSGMKMGGGPKQFGVDAEQVPELLAEIGKAGLAFEGFHLFAGSQNLRPEAIVEAQRKCFELACASPKAPRPGEVPQPGRRLRHPLFPRRTAPRPVEHRRQPRRHRRRSRRKCRTPRSSSNWAATWWAKPASTSPRCSTARSPAAMSFWSSTAGCITTCRRPATSGR
jgi:diaminopimelate decarboxylase